MTKRCNRITRIVRFYSVRFILIIGLIALVGVGCEYENLPDIPKTWTEVKWADVYPDFTYDGLSPSCAACPGDYNPEFSFFVKGGSTNKLVVYFQGGGACWDSVTCLYVHTYYEEVGITADYLNYLGEDPDGNGGILNFTRYKNPFKDWYFVYVPYCTGDIHWGANDQEYADISGFYGGEAQTIRHRGFVNFQVVLKWIEDNFGGPKKIFIAGSSAGAYGAIGSFPFIKEAFPKSEFFVIGDAGNGISSDSFKQDSIGNWNIQVPQWIPGYEGGYSPDMTSAGMYISYANYYPFSKVAQFTNAWDGTQAWFYNLQHTDENGFPLTWNPAEWVNFPYPEVWCDWHSQMLAFAYEAADEASNYRYYIAAGTGHTILMSSKFYEENSAGIPLVDWVESMVKNPFGKFGHFLEGKWKNLECEECGALVVCE
jgi:hypothetical protein